MIQELAADGTQKLKPSMSSRRSKFAKEYAIDFNGARAARSAGYAEGSAKVQAHRLLQRPDVQSGIETVMSELKMIAFADIAQLFETRQFQEHIGHDDLGEPIYRVIDRTVLRDITTLSSEITSSIKSVRTRPTRSGDVTEVKLHDKTNALDKLMRHHGGYRATYTPPYDPDESLLALILSDSSEDSSVAI